jgi:hypothetical protein
MEMTNKPKAWLPSQATDPAEIRAMLDRVLADWSEHWFKTELASATPAFQDDWPDSKAANIWRSIGHTASIALTPNAQLVMVSAMLGCPAPHGPAQPNDRVITEGMASSAADDLLVRIAELAGEKHAEFKPTSGPLVFDDCQWWEISFRSGKRAFKLSLERNALVSIIKRQLAPADKPKLRTIKSALAGQSIELTAEVGRCSISLSDLQDLATGDVIVLDRSSKDPLDLLIDGFASPFGGKLETTDGQASIVLDNFKDYHNA